MQKKIGSSFVLHCSLLLRLQQQITASSSAFFAQSCPHQNVCRSNQHVLEKGALLGSRLPLCFALRPPVPEGVRAFGQMGCAGLRVNDVQKKMQLKSDVICIAFCFLGCNNKSQPHPQLLFLPKAALTKMHVDTMHQFVLGNSGCSDHGSLFASPFGRL